MFKKYNAMLFYFSFFLIVVSILVMPEVAATSHLPKGLLVAQEYNNAMSKNFLLNVSFLVAFIAGIITILSPCIFPLLPAFFSYTFKEKKKITLMTLVFFLGFSIMFIIMGIIATVIGLASLTLLQEQYGIFIQVAGILLIIFGLLSLFGKGFSGIIIRKRL